LPANARDERAEQWDFWVALVTYQNEGGAADQNGNRKLDRNLH
jgi:hypothetical protein